MAKKPLQLVIGDKNLSSWSMRAWLVAEISGLPYKEILIPLDQPTSSAKIKRYSPSGKVPCLIDGTIAIWDSLAIAEYLAELAPQKNLWPENTKRRALSRAYCAEMHSSFASLRAQLSMDIRLRIKVRHLTPGTVTDIKRILELWEKALRQNHGPFLFGREFGIVDAFFAPVVMRFISYGIEIKSARIHAYMQKVTKHPAVKAWISAGLREKKYRHTTF